MFDFDATLPLMAIQFLVLMVLLNALFFKPLMKALDDRDQYIRSTDADAQTKLEKANQMMQQYQQDLAEARRQSQTLVANAQAEAQKVVAERTAAAQQEAQLQREQTQRELDQQKQEALRSLEQQVESLSRQIMAKVLG